MKNDRTFGGNQDDSRQVLSRGWTPTAPFQRWRWCLLRRTFERQSNCSELEDLRSESKGAQSISINKTNKHWSCPPWREMDSCWWQRPPGRAVVEPSWPETQCAAESEFENHIASDRRQDRHSFQLPTSRRPASIDSAASPTGWHRRPGWMTFSTKDLWHWFVRYRPPWLSTEHRTWHRNV